MFDQIFGPHGSAKLILKISYHTKTDFKFNFEFPSSQGKKERHIFTGFFFEERQFSW